jgi:hypothetical protein
LDVMSLLIVYMSHFEDFSDPYFVKAQVNAKTYSQKL